MSGLCAGATRESSSCTGDGVKKCPVHKSNNHTLQECKKLEGMSTSEKEKVVEEHRLCLSCLLPGHRLSKCPSRNRCKVEHLDRRHHTLLHEVDLKLIERARVKHTNYKHYRTAREIKPLSLGRARAHHQ